MILPEPKACTACKRCIFFHGLFLCTLPPECFDLRDDDGDPLELRGEWMGMDCDKARKQDGFCGPSGKMHKERL